MRFVSTLERADHPGRRTQCGGHEERPMRSPRTYWIRCPLITFCPKVLRSRRSGKAGFKNTRRVRVADQVKLRLERMRDACVEIRSEMLDRLVNRQSRYAAKARPCCIGRSYQIRDASQDVERDQVGNAWYSGNTTVPLLIIDTSHLRLKCSMRKIGKLSRNWNQ